MEFENLVNGLYETVQQVHKGQFLESPQLSGIQTFPLDKISPELVCFGNVVVAFSPFVKPDNYQETIDTYLFEQGFKREKTNLQKVDAFVKDDIHIILNTSMTNMYGKALGATYKTTFFAHSDQD